MRKCGADLIIDLALKRHNEAGQICHRLPLPGIKFFFMADRINIYFAVIAIKTEGKPALRFCLKAVRGSPQLLHAVLSYQKPVGQNYLD
jgi:hypothetical protein